MKAFLISIVMIIFTLTACQKENGNGDPSEEFVFESLVTSEDTLFPGETSVITAIATGYDLSYHWSASKGDLLGTGSEVTYLPSPCHVGTNSISCEIIDGNNQSETKTIDIVVL